MLLNPSVLDSINKLKAGKSCGNDGLSAEHFIHSDIRIAILLSLFYTSALKHGYLPSDFMKTVIVPLVKNKTGDTRSDVHNYRPIALVTVGSKIFENVLLGASHFITRGGSGFLPRSTIFFFCPNESTIFFSFRMKVQFFFYYQSIHCFIIWPNENDIMVLRAPRQHPHLPMTSGVNTILN